MVRTFGQARKALITVWSETTTLGSYTVSTHGRLIAIGVQKHEENNVFSFTFIAPDDKVHTAKLWSENFDLEVTANIVRIKRRPSARPMLLEQEDFSGYNVYEITFP